MTTWQVVITAVSGVLGAGGLGAFVQAVAGRRVRRVEAARSLSDGTLAWAEDLRADAREARQEAREARTEAAEARRAAAEAQRRVDELAEDMRELCAAILDPAASVEGLRELVRRNGRL